ncbi:MAG: YjbQ family protein [Desulfobacteraceae bacterium]|nr:YjbQ family protein [Desulfobacteraceae bacterium]
MLITVKSTRKSEMIDVTGKIQQAVAESGIREGIIHLFSMHTTAGITINEACDPDVRTDMLGVLNKLVPWEDNYRHLEGNSAAHVKTTLVGTAQTLMVENGALVLGTWQGIFFCEFDGPRTRKIRLDIFPSLDQ